VKVKDVHTSWVLRGAVLREYKLWECGDLYRLDAELGVFKASSPGLFALLLGMSSTPCMGPWTTEVPWC